MKPQLRGGTRGVDANGRKARADKRTRVGARRGRLRLSQPVLDKTRGRRDALGEIPSPDQRGVPSIVDGYRSVAEVNGNERKRY